MTVLAFDCSTQCCSAAVLDDQGRVLAHRSAVMARGQAEALMPMIVATLADAGRTWDQVDLVGVTVGPGTFTGLRIGLAAARGMAVASALPVAGVTTTAAVAQATQPEERRGRTVIACIDGKRSDVFIQAFDETLTPLGEPDALMPEDVAQRYPGPLLLAGDAALRVAAVLPGMALSQSTLPDARVVAALAQRLYRDGGALPPHPLYVRPPDVTLPGGVPSQPQGDR